MSHQSIVKFTHHSKITEEETQIKKTDDPLESYMPNQCSIVSWDASSLYQEPESVSINFKICDIFPSGEQTIQI